MYSEIFMNKFLELYFEAYTNDLIRYVENFNEIVIMMIYLSRLLCNNSVFLRLCGSPKIVLYQWGIRGRRCLSISKIEIFVYLVSIFNTLNSRAAQWVTMKIKSIYWVAAYAAVCTNDYKLKMYIYRKLCNPVLLDINWYF